MEGAPALVLGGPGARGGSGRVGAVATVAGWWEEGTGVRPPAVGRGCEGLNVTGRVPTSLVLRPWRRIGPVPPVAPVPLEIRGERIGLLVELRNR